MIQKEQKNEDIKNIGDEVDSIQAGIDVESMSHLFNILAKQYADPYGSIVRELTSNCFDAHTQANIEEEVNVGFKLDENNNEYIFFRDKGSGMTPEFMKNVYMKYGKSTKRNTNNAIGFFGIGSKSPFSIKSEYYILSRVDGIEYYYIIYIGDNGIPSSDILEKKETKESNGSEIRIFLDNDNESYDYKYYHRSISKEKQSFVEAIDKQLHYFRDVILHNITNNNDQIYNDKYFNNYKLYEFENFTYNDRSVETYLPDICYKRVRYKIQYNLLGVKQVNLPIGLNFEIGDLKVTPSRENIEYNEEQINKVKYKLRATCYEIINKYNSNEFILDDIFSFLKLYDNDIFTYKNIEFKDIKLSKIVGLLELNFNKKGSTKIKKYNLDKFNNLDIQASDKLIQGLINTCFTVHGEIKSGRLLSKNLNQAFDYIINDKIDVYNLDCKIDSSKHKTIGDGVIIQKNKKYKKLLEYIESFSNFTYSLKYNSKIKIARELRNYILNQVIFSSLDYSKVNSYKDTLNYELDKIGDINIYINRSRIRIDQKHNFESIDNVNEYIKSLPHQIVLIPKLKLFKVITSLKRFAIQNTKIHFVYCNKEVMNQIRLKNMKNVIEFSDFTKHRMFKEICTSYYIEKKLKHLFYFDSYNDSNIINFLKIFNYKLYEAYNNLSKKINDNRIYLDYKRNKDIEDFFNDCLELANEKKYIDQKLINVCNKLVEYLKGIEIFKHIDVINLHKNELNDIINHLKLLKIRINPKFYNMISENYEIQLIKESYEKQNYLNSLNKKAA